MEHKIKLGSLFGDGDWREEQPLLEGQLEFFGGVRARGVLLPFEDGISNLGKRENPKNYSVNMTLTRAVIKPTDGK